MIMVFFLKNDAVSVRTRSGWKWGEGGGNGELLENLYLVNHWIATSGSRLVVNRRRQEGNPVLKYVRNVRYEWGDIGTDFECGPTCGVLYLALKYHKLHPNYILTRLSGKEENKYACKILLALCNVDEPRHTLRELNLLCYRMDWTLVLCYSVEEAAEYIENLKLADNRDPTFKLLYNFGTLKAIAEASEEQLALCPGLGPIRAKNLYNYLRTSFTT
ncbi:unnamed protein product [Strongylus vulgaris]|uniref:ERCC1-like central domain-containing protein n=1 Tax=Strongylus vulgaris TaxID=40348 RepID=A0A3P7IY23_STRVU|nr:unnamed protein product [Strongylus vulgaris]